MTTAVDVRDQLVETLRRDLIGPGPNDHDIAAERLDVRPSVWYLAGFLAPSEDKVALGGADGDDDVEAQEDGEVAVEEADEEGAGGAAGDDGPPDAASARRRFMPSSIGLTVLLDPSVTTLKATITWGDYVAEPDPSEFLLVSNVEAEGSASGKRGRHEATPKFQWVRKAKTRVVDVPVVEGRSQHSIIVPESAPEQGKHRRPLVIETHSRTFELTTPEGQRRRLRALTVFLVNRRAPVNGRVVADLTYAFQARLELECATGFEARQDLSGHDANDADLRLADLHYRDVVEWAVGRNSAADWQEEDGKVTRVWTDALPTAEVERVAPNESIAGVTFGMEALAGLAEGDGATLAAALDGLPARYGEWIAQQKVGGLPPRRAETARELVADMQLAGRRIAEGIELLKADHRARQAFRFMNLAVARANRQRSAAQYGGKPEEQRAPAWRPFQLAFILLNLAGLTDKRHRDREIADLLFFPTGGGKTEAYLGLAAYCISLRRLSGSGVLGAGVSVMMRYTLRLLTLDQLDRAAGVVCALELMRVEGEGLGLLGDWPIEIGLWVGSDASPNRLGGQGDTGDDKAVTRVRTFRRDFATPKARAPAPLKACPWCATPFGKDSFVCTPDLKAPTNLEIRCANIDCKFTRDRPLPILVVDETIYRRLPAFIVATIDKLASLPWVGESGALFGQVDRFQAGVGFFGAAEPVGGQPLDNGWKLDPPDLIIQDELHLIAGPLGTVAGLYEAAIDQLCARGEGEGRVRPKIVASTATVRRAHDQIKALFDRNETRVFPPPGIDRTDSFFALTVPSIDDPARLYLGIAAQGRGPKLVFLRVLRALLAASKASLERDGQVADPYLTAVCYFNALRELGGARRIVEDEIRTQVADYGDRRRRVDPHDHPFANRAVREPLELTSRVSTDAVSAAKKRLEKAVSSDEGVDVALATNMISVGLDIQRLGLMLVQGQPKTAAEYIQATSRVGRDHDRPGLVATILNVHKPRDRAHFEQFGHFHRTFYRAVEATSVTPWAARALDRALAAAVVAAARHVDPALTPDRAAALLKDEPHIRVKVREALVARAPERQVAGGHAALRARIDDLFDNWLKTADEQTEGGASFRYREGSLAQHLLHRPLETGVENLSPAHREFVAGWSMRDVEPSVQLQVRDPWGNEVKADDV
ncbi:MAG TPA: DISARM system helicase DrmA [Caulobacteraceae bacterium]|nr:DISARM system helicase DrmA [Caulobacteraceae bacterium]